MLLQKTFQCSRLLIFFKLGVIVNFSIITRKICLGDICWSLFLMHVLIKLQYWWPATLLKKRPPPKKKTPVFSCGCLKSLKKTFYATPLVAASEIEMWMIRFLKDRTSSIFSDLYEMKRLNKEESHK